MPSSDTAVATPATPSPQTRRALRATAMQFFMNGAIFATWGVQIPALKLRFGVSDALMSLAMLCVAGGAVLAMQRVGRWVARLGSARALTISGLLYALALLAIPSMGGFGWLLPVLAAFGVVMAAFDVAMNVQAAAVEAGLGRPVMSTLHGTFSVGGMAGSAFGGLVLSAGLPLQAHAALVAAMVVAGALACASRMLADPADEDAVRRGAAPPDDAGPEGAAPDSSTPDSSTPESAAPDDAPQPKRRIPHALWVLGVVAFLGLVCEGAMYDWAALYMRDVAGEPLARSGYGYTAFSTGMVLGRFGADFVRRRLPEQRILTACAWLGFAGIALAIAWPAPTVALAGLFLMGLGVSNLMPFFFLAGTRLPGLSAAEGVAGVARFAYAGMLCGPPVIGALAHQATLRLGLGAVALTMGWIALSGIRRIYRVT